MHKSPFEINKHSSIVQMGNITTMQERKAMNALIYIARDQLKREPEIRIFTCTIGLLKRLTGVKENDNTDLKDALRTLHSLKFEFNVLHKDEGTEWRLLGFMSEVGIKESKGNPTIVTFEFPTSILEAIRNPNMYVKLDLMIVRGLESKHSIALYEVLKDYLNLWKFRFDLADFKKLMGIKSGQYSNFTMLRKRVLEVAIQEINAKTDIHAEFELEKFWRLTVAIFFRMQPKKQTKANSDLLSGVRAKLKFYWLSEQKIDDLLEKHEIEYLNDNIEIVEEQLAKGNVKNPTAYLLKALQQDYRSPESHYSKQKKEEDERAQIAMVKQTEEAALLESLIVAYTEEKRVKVEEVLQSLSDEETAQWKTAFLHSQEGNIFFKKYYPSKGREYPITQGQRYNYIALELLPEKYHNQNNYIAHKRAEGHGDLLVEA